MQCTCKASKLSNIEIDFLIKMSGDDSIIYIIISFSMQTQLTFTSRKIMHPKNIFANLLITLYK